MDERIEALADAYDALSGVKPLDAVARVLREGWHTPALLAAIAKRLDPSFEGEMDEYRLILVKRETLGPVDQRANEKRLEMVFDVMNTMIEARGSPGVKNAVADLCAKWGISKSTVYAIAKASNFSSGPLE